MSGWNEWNERNERSERNERARGSNWNWTALDLIPCCDDMLTCEMST